MRWGLLPENREQAVVETLAALGFTGDERVLDHYKVEISLEEALRNRLTIGKLTRSCVNQFAKLAKDLEPLQAMTGPDNKAKAEEYCWGREFVDLVTDFPGVVTEPQQLFHVLQRLTPRLYSIASSQAMHPDSVHTTVRVVRYESHGTGPAGSGERASGGACAGGLYAADFSACESVFQTAGGYFGSGDYDWAGDGGGAVSGVSGTSAGEG